MADAPSFDPAQPFETVAAPAFDPAQPFEAAPQQASKSFTLADTWPARMAKSIYSAVTLPGDVAAGKFNVAPTTPGMWSDEDEARRQLNDAEAMRRVDELKWLASPVAPGARIGEGIAGVPIKPPSAPSVAGTVGSEFADRFQPGAIKPGTASAEFGIPLSTGEAAKDFGQTQFEQTALKGGYGDAAQKKAQEFFDAQHEAINQARGQFGSDLDPFGQTIRESPIDTAELVGDSLRRTAQNAKDAYKQSYQEFSDLPGVIHAGAFEGIAQRIKANLSLGDNPVIIDDVTTPVANRALGDIEANIDRLKVQNRADPFGQPDAETIYGINLKGVDQTRKRLVIFGKAARNNPTDARAVGSIIHAFDQNIEDAISNGLFSGSDRALEALKEARYSFSQYQKTFKPRKNDGGVGSVMDKIVNRDDGAGATAAEVANFLYGASGTGANGLSVRLSQRLRNVLGADSPEWSAVRQGMWKRLTEPAEGKDDFGPQKISQRIFEFLNGSGQPLSRIMFSDAERAKMERLGNAIKETIPQRGTVNYSNTASTLARIIGNTSDLFAGGLGYLFGHIPGGAAMAWMTRLGRKAFEDQYQAHKVGKSLYGETPSSGLTIPRYIPGAAPALGIGLSQSGKDQSP